MADAFVSHGLKILRQRALKEGGFSNQDHSNYRTDATAWAILAFTPGGADQEFVNLSRSQLASSQLPDGRVPISSEHPEVYWPTSLAILAWYKSPAHQVMLARAAEFLLNHSGVVFELSAKGPDDHDTRLKGWPWVTGTYSWIDPTALGVIALKATGHGSHPRVLEARRMLMDRQCLHGGWNYGNRKVYDAELQPMPENTGLALDALKDLTPRSSVEPSLGYLKSRVQNLRTPIALTFSLLGLGAWGERPAAASARLAECWRLQEQLGAFDTTSISLLILASCLPGGLESIFGKDQDTPQG
jgi:hypothetical protein